MIRDSISAVCYHYREGNIAWVRLIFILLLHVASLVAFKDTIHKCMPQTLLFAFILWPITGFGITSGVHRLWAHRSYDASLFVRIFLMLCNSIACEGSIYNWAMAHRAHHKYSDTDQDPHDINRGFFYAHVGWLLLHKTPKILDAEARMDMSDILADPVCAFQKRFDPYFNLYMCFVMPCQVASYFWGEDMWNTFLVAGCLRCCWVLHCTWSVNSFAHLYGDHPYHPKAPSAENPIVSFMSLGEGWHNWHHKYPYDYAASEYGISSQFNPSKLLIDAFASVGLVTGRKRASAAWAVRRHRLDIAEEKQAPDKEVST